MGLLSTTGGAGAGAAAAAAAATGAAAAAAPVPFPKVGKCSVLFEVKEQHKLIHCI